MSRDTGDRGRTGERISFDGGQSRTRKTILAQVNERLKREPGVEYTRFVPGRIAPTSVVAAIEPTPFLGETYPAPHATLEVWWAPKSTGRDHAMIQWYETLDEAHPSTDSDVDPTITSHYTLACGWHQDDHHDELGPAHFQEEYPDGRTKRYGIQFDDVTPLWIVSRCLAELPDRLARFRNRLASEG
ncbi:hypothetical protein [Halovivax cerinus]|uniref:Polyketide cyclase / dehydrase and lipid transport n=1 Tax=Halovivax cerinus TaxID=1487865 RepID=A0ABD5NU38_9EURY|nr:hypothetical protein [Halovivax cerinus]